MKYLSFLLLFIVIGCASLPEEAKDIACGEDLGVLQKFCEKKLDKQ